MEQVAKLDDPRALVPRSPETCTLHASAVRRIGELTALSPQDDRLRTLHCPVKTCTCTMHDGRAYASNYGTSAWWIIICCLGLLEQFRRNNFATPWKHWRVESCQCTVGWTLYLMKSARRICHLKQLWFYIGSMHARSVLWYHLQ